MKKKWIRDALLSGIQTKTWKIMRLNAIFLFLCLSQAWAISGYSQATKLTLKMSDSKVIEVLDEIEEQSEFFFLFNQKLVDVERKVDIDVQEKSIDFILQNLFAGTNVNHMVIDRQIVLTTFKPELLARQQPAVSGTVTDESDEPLPGVTVVVKGTTQGTVTNADGNYSLSNIPEDAILQFSFVGMLTQEVVVGDQTKINIEMAVDAIGIEEVVAIGYGTQKKKLVTGATSRIEGNTIEKLNSTNPIKALQSTTSGINITKVSGSPGADYKFFIRGIGTIGNSNPLFVVDGVTVGNIKNLNPSDIESIDVLKDAASSAIYGARAANGVVLITTKQGKIGKPSISYDGYYGIQNIQHKIDMLNAQDFLTIATEAGQDPNTYSERVYNYDAIKNGSWKGTNWLDEFENKDAPIRNHNINITGGTEQSVYSLGAAYLSEEGFLGQPSPPSYERYSFRVNSEHKLIRNKEQRYDVLVVGENIYYSNASDSNGLSEGWGLQKVFSSLPFMPAFNEDGSFYIDSNNPWDDLLADNGIALLYYQSGENITTNSNLIANAYFIIQPIKDLKIRSSLGYTSGVSSRRAFNPKYRTSSRNSRGLNLIDQSMSNSSKWIFENTLTYDFSINKEHNFSCLAGVSAEKSGIGERINGTNFSPQLEGLKYAYLSNSTTIDATNGTRLTGMPIGEHKLASYFGRLNYDFKQTYLFTAVFRADGSSNFAPGNRWGYFPSVSAGWLISNESFMNNVSTWLDYLKMRGSWGQNGNQSIPPFQYLAPISNDPKFSNAFIGDDKTKFSVGYYPSILPNPDVTWEVSDQFDLGFDANFYKNRLSLTFDWYKKMTKDWLLRAPVPEIYGTGAPYINGGDIQNKGIELSLGWSNGAKSSFNYNVKLNASYNKNKVTRIANGEGIVHGASTNPLGITMSEMYRAQVGYPLGYFWGYTNIGIFQNQDEINNYKNSQDKVIQPNAVPGDYIRKDWNDDGVINDEDKTMIGDPNPDVVSNFSLNIDYKGFDFSFIINGVFGNQIAWAYFNGALVSANSMSSKMGRWHGEGTSSTQPRAAIQSPNETLFSDRYVSNGDYVRLSNITLGYDFKNLWTTLPLQQMRFYFAAQNLFTITGYKGLDPEVGAGGGDASGSGITNWAGGVDLAAYPLPRTLMVGISIKY